MKTDKETLKILSIGESLSELIGSDGWKAAKRMLITKLAILDSGMSMPDKISPEEYFTEARIRAGVVSVLMAWLREVEGTAAQSDANKELMAQEKEGYIIQF